MASIGWAGLIGLNILIVCAFLADLGISPISYPYDETTFDQNLYANIVFMALSLVYFIIRNKAIIKKYAKETEEQQKKAHKRLLIYVAVLLGSIFISLFYKCTHNMVYDF